MSRENKIVFNVFYDGKFKTLEDGVVWYDGGRCGTVESLSEELFGAIATELRLTLYGQRFWYKLPFESLNELKILYSASDNFSRMCEAANWTRCIDIYIEKDEDSDKEAGNDGNHAFNEEEKDDDEEGNDGDASTEVCEEEDRVEKIVADVVDDDDEDSNAYPVTPPPSDGEEEEDTIRYERWKRGSGALAIRQVFESVEEFKEAVVEYVLLGGWNVRYTRWGKLKYEAKCGVVSETPCQWRIYCSYENSVDQWMIKTYQDEHTCIKDGRCKILSEGIIAKLILNDIRNDPKMKPKAIQAQFEERYNLMPSDDQCRKARKRALEMIQDEYDEQFKRIKDYSLQILDSNPGSTVDIRTAARDGVLEMFDRFYVCFAALRDSWLANCRPIFGIDGCFLKSSTKGQLLAAVGRDGNNQIYPIAWAVVQIENTESWLWFIQKLKHDLKLGNGEGFTLISDRQKGLLIAVEQELPNVEHRMCARHIYGNLRKFHSKKPRLKTLYWEVVRSFNTADYEANMERLKEYDHPFYKEMMKKNPKMFCRAFFQTTSSCEDALNNFSESYNSTLEKARSMPLVEMLETMRRQTMVRNEIRRKKTEKWKKMHSKKVAKVLAEEEKERKWCVAIPSSNGMYEVIEKGTAHKVNMRVRSCTCRRWDLTGIPCRHALRVMMQKKINSEDYISHWYLTVKWQQQYNDAIKPMVGLKFWRKSGERTLEAPPREVSKGRNKKPEKRKKAINESPTKGKRVTNHGRIMHCTRCGGAGHNSLKCVNDGAPNKPRKPKKAKTNESNAGAETMNIDYEVGPSQQSQATQHEFE